MKTSRRALVASILLAGCGGSVALVDGGVSDSASNDALVVDANVDAPKDADASTSDGNPKPFDGGCNTVVNSSPFTVDITQTTVTPPTPQGGSIANGTYYLETINDYGSISGTLAFGARVTVALQGTDFEFVLDLSNVTSRGSETLTTNGTNYNASESCPTVTTVGSGTYTATPSELRLYENADGGVLESIYAHQ